MHSIAITILIGLVLLTQAIDLAFPYAIELIVLAFAIGFIGLPDGALDHLIGRRLLDRLPASLAYIVFGCSYLVVASVVIAGWFLSPLVTVLGFFCLSGWHFGLEEDQRSKISRFQWIAMIARGGMVVWVLALFQGEAVTRILADILPGGDTNVAGQIVGIVRAVAPALLVLTICDLLSFRNEAQVARLGVDSRRQHQARTVAFFVLFAVADPLISFGIYFCGWHSIRGLVHLREQANLPVKEFLIKLLPIIAVTIVLFAAGFFIKLNTSLFTEAVLQTLFIGLSAVAIPHLLLHVLSDSIRSNQIQGAVS